MYEHILVPVALDHHDRASSALAVAEALAGAEGKITLLHVQEIVPSYVESYIPDEVFERNKVETQRMLDELAAETSLKAETDVVPGHPARTIVDYGEKRGVDCIVLASHHPGVADYFLGSTAAWVARHADCAIHILR